MPDHATYRSQVLDHLGQGAPPAQVVYHIEGALTSSLTARQTLIDQHSCFILATNELDFASSLSLKKPERIMALLMVMTVCFLVYAALKYRIRQALKDHDATFPDQKGTPVQNPTAR